MNDKKICVITQWIRNIHIQSFPIELVDIIMLYLKVVLTWSRTECWNGTTFISDNRIKLDNQTNGPDYVLCCTDECISSEFGNVFSWEMIFHTKSRNSLPGFIGKEYLIAYTSPPFKLNGSCYNLHHSKDMWVCNSDQNKVKVTQGSINVSKDLSDGDRIGFRANFKIRTMEAFFNGEWKGVAWSNIPKEFVVVTAVCRGIDDIEIVYREDDFEKKD